MNEDKEILKKNIWIDISNLFIFKSLIGNVLFERNLRKKNLYFSVKVYW